MNWKKNCFILDICIYIAIHIIYPLKKGSPLHIHYIYYWVNIKWIEMRFCFIWDVGSVSKIRVDCVKEAIPSIFFLLGNDERRVRESPLLVFGDHQHHHRLFFRRKAAPPPEDHHQLTKIKKGGRPNLLAKRCIHHYHHHHHFFWNLLFDY